MEDKPDHQKLQQKAMGKEFWDKRFEADEYAYGEQANAFFSAQIHKLPPGNLLLPAEGEGRNAVYAASNGWKVEAVDFSAEARSKALKLARRNGVRISYFVSDLTHFAPDQEYDVIAFIFFHAGPEIREQVLKQYQQYLKPMSLFLLEGFNPMQIGNPSGGPKAPPFCYTKKELSEWFAGWDIKLLEDVETTLQEGPYHQGTACTTRLIARKT